MLMGDLAGWFSITPEEMAPLGWTSADIVFLTFDSGGFLQVIATLWHQD